MIRHPKTTTERRWNEAHKREGIKVRARRNYIPTAWDDLWVKTQRSWKKYRKTQWK